jgi:hypothetical protein
MNLPPENSFEEFQGLCFAGIPDRFRAKSWKLLLKILPFEDRTAWKEQILEQRESYYSFFDQFLRDPTQEEIISLKDSSNLNSISRELNFELLEQIDRDVRRTFPDLAFFQKAIQPSLNCPLYSNRLKEKRRSLVNWLKHSRTEQEFGVRRRTATNTIPTDTPDFHWESIERILYIHCMVNPGIGYVQGMNNILAPIYYVCANDTDPDFRGKTSLNQNMQKQKVSLSLPQSCLSYEICLVGLWMKSHSSLHWSEVDLMNP